jgi:hypothetical protein
MEEEDAVNERMKKAEEAEENDEFERKDDGWQCHIELAIPWMK